MGSDACVWGAACQFGFLEGMQVLVGGGTVLWSQHPAGSSQPPRPRWWLSPRPGCSRRASALYSTLVSTATTTHGKNKMSVLAARGPGWVSKLPQSSGSALLSLFALHRCLPANACPLASTSTSQKSVSERAGSPGKGRSLGLESPGPRMKELLPYQFTVLPP